MTTKDRVYCTNEYYTQGMGTCDKIESMFRAGQSIKQIAKHTRIRKKIIRKYIAVNIVKLTA